MNASHRGAPDFTIVGDVADLRLSAQQLDRNSTLFGDIERALKAVEVTGWSGPASDIFRERFHTEPSRWAEASWAFRHAAEVLDEYADVLEQCQQAAQECRERYAHGTELNVQTAWRHVDTAIFSSQTSAAVTRPGDALRESALSDFARIMSDLNRAGDQCARALEAACDLAPAERSWLDEAAAFFGGAAEALFDLGKLLFLPVTNTITLGEQLSQWWDGKLTPSEVLALQMRPFEQAADLASAAWNRPGETFINVVSAVADVETWADDPARAAGRLVPDAVISVLTAGSGTVATKGASLVTKIDGIYAGLKGTRVLNHLPSHLDDLHLSSPIKNVNDLPHTKLIPDSTHGSVHELGLSRKPSPASASAPGAAPASLPERAPSLPPSAGSTHHAPTSPPTPQAQAQAEPLAELERRLYTRTHTSNAPSSAHTSIDHDRLLRRLDPTPEVSAHQKDAVLEARSPSPDAGRDMEVSSATHTGDARANVSADPSPHGSDQPRSAPPNTPTEATTPSSNALSNADSPVGRDAAPQAEAASLRGDDASAPTPTRDADSSGAAADHASEPVGKNDTDDNTVVSTHKDEEAPTRSDKPDTLDDDTNLETQPNTDTDTNTDAGLNPDSTATGVNKAHTESSSSSTHSKNDPENNSIPDSPGRNSAPDNSVEPGKTHEPDTDNSTAANNKVNDAEADEASTTGNDEKKVNWELTPEVEARRAVRPNSIDDICACLTRYDPEERLVLAPPEDASGMDPTTRSLIKDIDEIFGRNEDGSLRSYNEWHAKYSKWIEDSAEIYHGAYRAESHLFGNAVPEKSETTGIEGMVHNGMTHHKTTGIQDTLRRLYDLPEDGVIRFDRIGEPSGQYLGLIGKDGPASFGERSLAPTSVHGKYYVYELNVDDLPEGWSMTVGKVAPWHGGKGGGIQIQFFEADRETKTVLEVRVSELVRRGIIRKVDL